MIGISAIGASAFGSPGDLGADPRILASVEFTANGGFFALLARDISCEMDPGGSGTATVTLHRKKAIQADFIGIPGFGVDLSVNPVLVNIDGAGTLTASLNYSPGTIKARGNAAGSLTVGADRARYGYAWIGAGGGMAATVNVTEMLKARAEAGGGLATRLSVRVLMSVTMESEGTLRSGAWYDLQGPAIRVTPVTADTIRVTPTIGDVIRVNVVVPDDIIVLSEGF